MQESPDGKTITVTKGDTVRLIVTSKDTTHGLGIDEFGVDTGEIAVAVPKPWNSWLRLLERLHTIAQCIAAQNIRTKKEH